MKKQSKAWKWPFKKMLEKKVMNIMQNQVKYLKLNNFLSYLLLFYKPILI